VFIGHLATQLGSGGSLHQAVRWATAAATLSAQIPGTHNSYPDLTRTAEALEALPDSTVDSGQLS
jgi:sugar/nucleoside kinase (ribokinase family)